MKRVSSKKSAEMNTYEKDWNKVFNYGLSLIVKWLII